MPDSDTPHQENIPSPAQLIANLAAEQQARKALERQLSEHSAREQQLQAQMQRYQEIDPEKYQQLLEEAAAREEQDLLNQKEFEKLKQRYQTEAKFAKKTADSWERKYQELLTKNAIEAAFYQAGGKRFSGEDGEAAPVDLIAAILAPKLQILGSTVVLTELDSEGHPKLLEAKMLELRKGNLKELFHAETANNAAPLHADDRRAFTREQARSGRAPIDKIASGEAAIY